MTTQNNDISAFFLGLALALEKIRHIVLEASPNLKAFLFDFSDPKTGEYIDNLFRFMGRLDSYDGWIDLCKDQFFKDPLLEEVTLRGEASRMFEIIKKLYPEDCFNSSLIKPVFRRAAEETYSQHQPFYKRLVCAIYQNQPSLGFDMGIVFVDKSE